MESDTNGSYINMITMGFVALFYNGYNIFWRIVCSQVVLEGQESSSVKVTSGTVLTHYYFCATYINDL